MQIDHLVNTLFAKHAFTFLLFILLPTSLCSFLSEGLR